MYNTEVRTMRNGKVSVTIRRGLLTLAVVYQTDGMSVQDTEQVASGIVLALPALDPIKAPETAISVPTPVFFD